MEHVAREWMIYDRQPTPYIKSVLQEGAKKQHIILIFRVWFENNFFNLIILLMSIYLTRILHYVSLFMYTAYVLLFMILIIILRMPYIME